MQRVHVCGFSWTGIDLRVFTRESLLCGTVPADGKGEGRKEEWHETLLRSSLYMYKYMWRWMQIVCALAFVFALVRNCAVVYACGWVSLFYFILCGIENTDWLLQSCAILKSTTVYRWSRRCASFNNLSPYNGSWPLCVIGFSGLLNDIRVVIATSGAYINW